MFKQLYSFSIEDTKEVEEKTKEKRKNKDGDEKEVEVSQKIQKKIPFKFVIKEPSRRELEEADMEYSIEMSRCIKKGVLTKAMLAKKYSDTGGLLAESDANKLVELYGELASIEGEYTKKTLANRDVKKLPAQIKKEIDELSGKAALARRDIVNLESAYQSLFNHTADTKAQNRIILWYITHLTYFESTEGGVEKETPYFPGKSFDEKVDHYYLREESEDSLFGVVAGKLASIISYWYFSNEPTKEEFDKIINDIDGTS